MTPEEIKQLLTESLTEIKTELLSEVDKKNQGLAASLTKEIKKLTTSPTPVLSTEGDSEEPKEKLSLKALQQQISDLQTQLTEKDKQAFAAKRSQAVSSAISKTNALSAPTFHKLFMLEHESLLKEEEGNWFVDKGGNIIGLDDAVKNYLNTDEGKFFVPPSGVNGSSSQETKTTPATPGTKPKAADLLFDAISNLND
ncbi:hypothetical protein NIES2100_35150 [Calothrix sp. NIES-2100]|uniref:phage scaffolding protein n=1 Tax=Calothrix sp. NIES-2100 TaxID=1954172 RepID=UPI000B5DD8A5|nr:hypothetical protein NIES2100_35150 [Calothrix sp. NIES-2100]